MQGGNESVGGKDQQPSRVISYAPRTSHTYHFHHGFNIPAAERARSGPPNARRVHPGFKHRERHLRHPPCSSCLWICWRPLDYNSGAFSTNVLILTCGLCLFRTRWPMIRITSTLGGLAVMYAKSFTGNWRGDARIDSTSPSSLRLEI
jgi:hypothetical protein